MPRDEGDVRIQGWTIGTESTRQANTPIGDSVCEDHDWNTAQERGRVFDMTCRIKQGSKICRSRAPRLSTRLLLRLF